MRRRRRHDDGIDRVTCHNNAVESRAAVAAVAVGARAGGEHGGAAVVPGGRGDARGAQADALGRRAAAESQSGGRGAPRARHGPRRLRRRRHHGQNSLLRMNFD